MSAHQVPIGLENGRHHRGYPREMSGELAPALLEHFREQWNALMGGADPRWELPRLAPGRMVVGGGVDDVEIVRGAP